MPISVKDRNGWCMNQCVKDPSKKECKPGKPNAVGDAIQCKIDGVDTWVSASSGMKPKKSRGRKHRSGSRKHRSGSRKHRSGSRKHRSRSRKHKSRECK
jgi:hypothetical protein